MLDAGGQQLVGGGALFGQGVHRQPQHLAQFLGVRLHQPGHRLQAGTQGFATAVQRHLQALGLEGFQQCAQPLRADAAWQAAGHHHHVMAGRDLRKPAQQLGLSSFVHLRALAVDVSDPAIGFHQLDIAAGFARHTHEAIGETAPLDQRLEGLQVVAPQEATDGNVVPQVGQHLGDVQALARRVAVLGLAAVDLAGAQVVEADGDVQRGVEGEGEDLGHLSNAPPAPVPLRRCLVAGPRAPVRGPQNDRPGAPVP